MEIVQLRILLLSLCLPAVRAVSGGQKSVVVSVDSKWSQTSILLEASEFIAKESEQQFWNFVNNIAAYSQDAEKSLQIFDDKDLYELAQKESAKILSSARLDLLKLSLSLRAFSPAVEMYRQIALHSDATEDCAGKCKIFVEVHGRTTCNLSQLDSLLESSKERIASAVFHVDHHYPGSKGVNTLVVLYADLTDSEFAGWHKTLQRKAEKREVDYILRHFVQNPPEKKVRLSGYGVELAIKSTEYKAQDDSKIRANLTEGGAVVEEQEEEDLNGFNFKVLKDLHSGLKESLQEFKLHLLEADELTPLKVWQLQDLSFQAAQRVVNAEPNEALHVLEDISQNFPLIARSLTRTVVKSEFRKEVEKNQAETLEDMGISPGESALFINGLLIDMDSLDIYQLLDTLKREEMLSAGFFRMGFRRRRYKRTHYSHAQPQKMVNEMKREYLSLLVNLDLREEKTSYAIDYRPAFPEYINDLDKDPQYREWGNSVKLMVTPYFPGMIRPIARNFFTLVFLVDPATKEGRSLLKIGYSFYIHEIPIRVGFVFVVSPDRSVTGLEDAGVALLNLFNFVKGDQGSPAKGLSAVTDVFDLIQGEGRDTTQEDVVNYFKKRYPGEDVDLVFGEDSDYDEGRQAGPSFLESSGLGKAPKVLLNGIPLDDSGVSADRFEETVIGEIMKVTPKIQKAVSEGKLTDSMNVQEFLLNQPDVMPRLNSRILGGSKENQEKNKFLGFTDVMEYKAKSVKEFSDLSLQQQNAFMVKQMKYFKRSEDLGVRPVTFWVVADLETSEGRELYYNAIKQLKHTHNMRLGLIHNPSKPEITGSETVSIARLVEGAVRLLPMNYGKMLATKFVKEENVVGLNKKTTTVEDLEVHGMNMPSFTKELRLMSDEFLKIHSYYVTKVLELLPGQRAIVANGQVIGPLGEKEEFLTEDFGVLEKFVLAQSAQSIADQVKAWAIEDEEEKSSDVVMRVSSLVLNEPIKKRRFWVVLQDDKYSVTIPASDETTAAFDVVAIVNPLSREAQKMSTLLIVLNAVINADLKLVMNCKPKLSEMPLKSFYRLVLEPELKFAPDGSLRMAPYARFSALPQKQLLTLNVIPPEAWLVESVKALYDLDNIKMDLVESSVVAEYELEYLLLEGHCFDEVTGNPPRGLQFTLGTDKNPVMVDTIVMANLGYFQLKANPGAWVLRLREGRSAEIYDITTHHNTDSAFNSPDVRVIMDSFTGKIIRIRVAKKPDRIQENLLSDGKETADEGSLWQTISSKFTAGEPEEEDPTINIFSLASGHLYERFMRLDLEGAPYGYTPFCDSRKEMDGFRFWRSGYWANHLGNRKYHISALYVVDLKKFRQIAAGDRLRGQYQGLSADPNSLSNLDQDLPNNMIHQVKIKSLPQEWLWCETWCDEKSKSSAKTIDLCNNPQTKEPKLESAMRIIPEWKDLDSEIKGVQQRYEQGLPANKIPSPESVIVQEPDKKEPEHQHPDL